MKIAFYDGNIGLLRAKFYQLKYQNYEMFHKKTLDIMYLMFTIKMQFHCVTFGIYFGNGPSSSILGAIT